RPEGSAATGWSPETAGRRPRYRHVPRVGARRAAAATRQERRRRQTSLVSPGPSKPPGCSSATSSHNRSSGETARSLYYRKLNQKGTEWVRALAGPTILGLEIEKSLGGVLPSVAADAQIGLFLVAPEALDRAEP